MGDLNFGTMYKWDLTIKTRRELEQKTGQKREKGHFKWKLQTRGRQKHARRAVLGAAASSRDFRTFTNNVKGNLSYAEARVLRIEPDKDRRLLDKAQRDRLFYRNLRRKQREQQLQREKENARAQRKKEMLQAAHGPGNRKKKKRESLASSETEGDEAGNDLQSEECTNEIDGGSSVYSEESSTGDMESSVTKGLGLDDGDPELPYNPVVEPVRKNTSFVYTFARPHTSQPKMNLHRSFHALATNESRGSYSSLNLRSSIVFEKAPTLRRFPYDEVKNSRPNIAPDKYDIRSVSGLNDIRFSSAPKVGSCFKKRYFASRSQLGERELEDLMFEMNHADCNTSPTTANASPEKQKFRKLARLDTMRIIQKKRAVRAKRRTFKQQSPKRSPKHKSEPLWKLPIHRRKDFHPSPFDEDPFGEDNTWEDLERLYKQISPLKERRRPGESPLPKAKNPFFFEGGKKTRPRKHRARMYMPPAPKAEKESR